MNHVREKVEEMLRVKSPLDLEECLTEIRSSFGEGIVEDLALDDIHTFEKHFVIDRERNQIVSVVKRAETVTIRQVLKTILLQFKEAGATEMGSRELEGLLDKRLGSSAWRKAVKMHYGSLYKFLKNRAPFEVAYLEEEYFYPTEVDSEDDSRDKEFSISLDNSTKYEYYKGDEKSGSDGSQKNLLNKDFIKLRSENSRMIRELNYLKRTIKRLEEENKVLREYLKK